jgi:hypothetical protein
MRITREMLLKVARDTIALRARERRGLVAAYLCGSLLEEDYLLGGTADIDLVLLHADPVGVEREIVGLTDEVHLDIAHHYQGEYNQVRGLRTHPWLGPLLNGCKVLYDPQHFMDFIQASVRGQFDRPDNVLARAHKQVEVARSIWLKNQGETSLTEPPDVEAYFRAVIHAANAVAGLSGAPLTERRFLLNFPARAEAVDRPGLYPGLLGLLGTPRLEEGSLDKWLSMWQASYQAIPVEQAPARLHPKRFLYYREAFNAMLSGSQPEAILWPLLKTWTTATGLFQEASSERQNWHQACGQLGLIGEGLAERYQALDAYLDLVDETLEAWGEANGV